MSTGGIASSIVPTSTAVTTGITSTSGIASSVPSISTDLTDAIISTSQLGVNAFPTTPSTITTPTTTPIIPTPTTITTPIIPTTTQTTTTTGKSGTTSATTTHALGGTGQGTFTNPLDQNDLTVDDMTTYNFDGTANLADMGAVTVTGTVHSVGFVLSGQATGQLTFTNSKGSVTVQLTGPVQEGFSPLPESFSYKVVSHTGTAYKSLADQGTLALVVPPTTSGYVLSGQGQFQLVIPS